MANLYDLHIAHELYAKKDFAKAFKIYKEVAKDDNTIAQRRLSHMYMMGEGTKQSFNKALFWHQMAGSYENCS